MPSSSAVRTACETLDTALSTLEHNRGGTTGPPASSVELSRATNDVKTAAAKCGLMAAKDLSSAAEGGLLTALQQAVLGLLQIFTSIMVGAGQLQRQDTLSPASRICQLSKEVMQSLTISPEKANRASKQLMAEADAANTVPFTNRAAINDNYTKMFERISGVAKEVKQFLEEDGGSDDSSEDGVGVRMSPAALSSQALQIATSVRDFAVSTSALLMSLLVFLATAEDDSALGDQAQWDQMFDDFGVMSLALNDLAAGTYPPQEEQELAINAAQAHFMLMFLEAKLPAGNGMIREAFDQASKAGETLVALAGPVASDDKE